MIIIIFTCPLLCAAGASNGMLAYVGRAGDSRNKPFHSQTALGAANIEISDDLLVINPGERGTYIVKPITTQPDQTGAGTDAIYPSGRHPTSTPSGSNGPDATPPAGTDGDDAAPVARALGLSWSGELPSQKWMNLYTKVLSKFATAKGLKLKVTVDVRPDDGLSPRIVDDTRLAHCELRLPDDVEVKSAAVYRPAPCGWLRDPGIAPCIGWAVGL